jgi:hypothetical protein
MIGLMVYLACGLWILFAVYLGGTIPKWLAIKRQGIAAAVLIPLIAVAPFYDEIIGKYQFKRLCDKYEKVQAITQNQSYTKLTVVSRTTIELTDAIRPTSILVDQYADGAGNKIVRSDRTLSQVDGWVLRGLGLAGTSFCETALVWHLPPREEAERGYRAQEYSSKGSLQTVLKRPTSELGKTLEQFDISKRQM